MDFFKNVTARVGDVAKNVGDLLLDSDSDSEADERSERTRRGGEGADVGEGEGSSPGGRRPDARGAGVAAGGASDSDRDEAEDGPLISEDVWNTLRAAKDRVARAAKSTAASVARDVAAAAETVRRDLGELEDAVESPDEVVFVGDAASEYAAGGAGGLGVSVEGDDDDGDGDGFRSDGDGSLDPDVVETFERTAEALENVGEKVEKFGAAVFQNAGRLFDAVVDTFDEEDEDDDDPDGRDVFDGATRKTRAKPPYGSFVSRSRDETKGKRKPPRRVESPPTAADEPSATTAIESDFAKKVAAMQRDSSTYCDAPADAAAFGAFARTFDAASDETKRDVDALLAANSFMKVMSGRIVPAVVEYEVFWSRYFFQLRLLERERNAALEALEARREAGGSPAAASKETKNPESMERASTSATDFREGGPPRDAGDAEARFSATSVTKRDETRVHARSSSTEKEDEDGNAADPAAAAAEEETAAARRGAPRTKKKPFANEKSGERVVVAGDVSDDASAPGHRRVVSLATDDGTVASDDSLGRDWTRVRDVESPSGLGEAGAEAGAEASAEAGAVVDDVVDEKAKDESSSSLRRSADPPPEAPTGAGDDSDLDEDWGMDSD